MSLLSCFRRLLLDGFILGNVTTYVNFIACIEMETYQVVILLKQMSNAVISNCNMKNSECTLPFEKPYSI